MGHSRFEADFGDDEAYDYDVDRARELVENDFSDYQTLVSATENVLKVLSTDVVDVTPVTTNGYGHYSIVDVDAIGEERKVRPVNMNLFIDDVTEFRSTAERFSGFLNTVGETRGTDAAIEEEFPEFTQENRINEVLYTMCQGVGIGLDSLSSSKNKARKHAGLRFESAIEKVMDELRVGNDSHYFKIPIDDSGDEYSCEVDMIIGARDQINTTVGSLDEDEVVVSIKTTSKDRMTKVFTDKVLISQFLNQEVPLIALFLHDVQRKGQDGIGGTFVANNYYIYHEYLTPIEGTYFIDPPKKIDEPGYSDKLSTYKELITNDIWELID